MIALDILQVALLALGSAATRCGYTICFRASSEGGGEYVAVPWSDGASSSEELIKAVVADVGLDPANVSPPVEEVFGRVIYLLKLSQVRHILLHVTPRYTVFKIEAPELSEPGTLH